jgi:hypothetical protein
MADLDWRDDPDHKPNGDWREGNQGNLKHGGFGALLRLQRGDPLVGLALELQEAVHQELETDGLLALMRERAERIQAICDLFYGLCLGAGDAEPLDKFVKRYGWLQGQAQRMWLAVAELEKAQGDGKVLDYETILAAAAQKEGEAGGNS